MDDDTKWWLAFGSVGQMIAAIAAVAALFFVAYQISQIEVNDRKANARQVYLAYSAAGMQYPEFLKPDYPAIRQNPVKFEQYKWYVTQMLMAYDEVFDAGDDPVWVKAFAFELPDHVPLFCELKKTEPAFFTQFTDRTNALLDQALKGKCG